MALKKEVASRVCRSVDEDGIYYEFIEFIRIIDNNDYDFAKKMLELSLIVAKVMNEARNQEKIVFTNDN